MKGYKPRKVCSLPKHDYFGPKTTNSNKDNSITLNLDEYETIRLIDFEGLEQKDCAKQMEVGRTTVTAIYARARKKIASALVLNKPILIKGGTYKICDDGKVCGVGCKNIDNKNTVN